MEININEEMQSMLPAVLARMRTELTDRIAREAENAAVDEVRKAAKEWALAVLVPEMKAQLEAGKDGFVAAATETAKALSQTITDALVENAKKNLQSSWNVQELAKKLFA